MFKPFVVLIVCLVGVVCVTAKPFPPPEPEAVARCSGAFNETICGAHGTCEEKVVDDEKIKVCVCEEQYGSLHFDTAHPCTRERISKSLVFWLQLFLGAIQVGAFVLHWWWYALSVYIVYGILCCCGCMLCANSVSDAEKSSEGIWACFNCFACIAMCVILAMWITNLYYICADCHSVIEITSGSHTGEHALKCWINM